MKKKDIPNSIPNRQLREQRELRGWTQEELAEKVDVSSVTVSRWESGTLPSLYHRNMLCKVFGKSPQELGFIRKEADEWSKKHSQPSPLGQDTGAGAPQASPVNQAATPQTVGRSESNRPHSPLNQTAPEDSKHNDTNPEQITLLWSSNITDEPYYRLPGREQYLDQLLTMLQDIQGPLVIVISGLGGLGKTSLAVELARRALQQRLFEGVVGDSAQQEFFTGGEIVQVNEAILGFDRLLDSIAGQLGRWELVTLKPEEKLANVVYLLRQHRYLILVDNLETAENAANLVIRLRSLLSPGRAIVTSRRKVSYDFAHVLSLRELELEDSHFFLKMELQRRGENHPLLTPEETLVEIHKVTGGAALAMKLVVAQARFLDLDVILGQLRHARGGLYTFIFRRSWERLSPAAQRVLIYIGKTAMTTVSWEELDSVGIAEDEGKLVEAIEQLVAYSLLDISSASGQKRYGIHQLTRQFVNGELPKMWREQGLS